MNHQWVKASPGVGKSVLSAYAIQKLSETNPSASPVYQYYSFDEVFSSLQVYRSIAEQLANRLWTHLEDMPEDIHSFTQHTTTAEQLPSSFLFLDGIDEECDAGPRMEAVSDIIEFFTHLTSCSTSSYNLHLWCSSQDRTDLVPYMEKFSVIEISKDTNSADIETYLSKSIMKLDSLDLHEGYQNLILKDLREKADGCFLWAALMLASVSKAKTLSEVQSKVVEGLPTNYEKYYQQKIESIEASERVFVSKILACIVYAKRPLRLDELCESIAVLGTEDCKNVNRSERLRPNMVLKLCQPLVQIEDVVGAPSTVPICTLTHASVRKFLVKHPQILSTSESPAACWITEEVMANVCLKYLWQPRYQRLLTKSEDTFKDYTGEDIMEHHILSYAAKYWDKHLDNVPYTEKLCRRFWLSANRKWAGPHLKRVFPSWLQSHCDQQLDIKYSTFVGEWGHVLDQVTNISGMYPGEIDRCLWGSLGSNNFLHKGPSKYRSFVFEDAESREISEGVHRFYDGVDVSGENYVVLKLENLLTRKSGSGSEQLEFTCQQWTLSSRRPKLKQSQKLIASRSDWSLYDYPTMNKSLGRPVPVSLTDDLQYIRIGSQLFTKVGDKYTPLKVFDEGENYFEELSSSGPYIALSSRQKVLHEDLPNEAPRDEVILDYGLYLAEVVQKITEAQDESAKASTAPTTNAETQSTQSTESSTSSSNSSVSSLVIEDEEEIKPSTEDEVNVEELEEWEEASEISSDGNSAETEWSEGSTVGEFEELDDDDQWNDWGNERLTIEDLNNDIEDYSHPDQNDDDEVADISDSDVSSVSSEPGNELEGFGLRTEAEIEMLISGVPGFVLKRALLSGETNDSDSVESHYSHSGYSSSESDEEEFSEIDNEDAHKLEDLMLGRNDLKGKESRRISLRIFNTTTGDQTPIFHYSQRTVGTIYHSPPAFHPSKPLLVWALGNGEILFANFERNTYFTRELCCSTYNSCHIFVKIHFSPCGGFVHFAALEGRPADDASEMYLSLQVSTHRLSTRKTASSPPKLTFRTAVPLGGSTSMSVSRLPYTLTWTPKELYFVTRGIRLDVVKIPLFKACEGETATPICYTQNPVYLPRSAESRNVYYFPPSLSSKAKKDKEKDKGETAKVIIGSHSSIPSQGLIVPKKHMVQPPIGFLVKEQTDLGGWMCKSMEANQGKGKDRINLGGGRLKGKFESFDLKEDCDIIPFLF
ncbi:Zinc finger protein [Rutstroemia sp. NJR-2017a BBW]|nr:Zinc finger protein [Rutstroemia sp. NJR-2017a BBW]